jgi:hypothetical protein
MVSRIDNSICAWLINYFKETVCQKREQERKKSVPTILVAVNSVVAMALQKNTLSKGLFCDFVTGHI